MNNKETEFEKSKVFIPIDVKSFSFKTSVSNAFGAKRILLFMVCIVLYILVAVGLQPILQDFMQDKSSTRSIIILFILFILVEQLPFRKFILNEEENLAKYENLVNNKMTKISMFYNIKPNGLKNTKEGHCRVEYRDGTVAYFVKILKGSMASDIIEDSRIQSTALNAILLDFAKRYFLYDVFMCDEHPERESNLGFFQKQLLTGDFDTEFSELCKDSLFLLNQITKHFCHISCTCIKVYAQYPKKILELDKFMQTYSGSYIKNTNYRAFQILNKQQVLYYFADELGFEKLTETDLTDSYISPNFNYGYTGIIDIKQRDEEFDTSKDIFRMNNLISKIDMYDLNSLTKVKSLEDYKRTKSKRNDKQQEELLEVNTKETVDNQQLQEETPIPKTNNKLNIMLNLAESNDITNIIEDIIGSEDDTSVQTTKQNTIPQQIKEDPFAIFEEKEQTTPTEIQETQVITDESIKDLRNSSNPVSVINSLVNPDVEKIIF